MKTLRERFEEDEVVKRVLDIKGPKEHNSIWWDEKQGEYVGYEDVRDQDWLNGAFYMFCEYNQEQPPEYAAGDTVKFVKNKMVDGQYFPIEIGKELIVNNFYQNEATGEKWLDCDGWALGYDQLVKK